MGMQAPTKMRLVSDAEYRIVTGVFGPTLPVRQRILVTDAAGLDGRAFTIPTSLLTTVFGINPALLAISIAGGYLGSVANAAYLINAGADYNALATTEQALLVHEMTHVWQGHNSTFALSYVFSSLLNQGLHGAGAYGYTAGKAWSSYNAEQQATIVEDWFSTGHSTSSPLYPYISDHIRKGTV